MKRKRQVYQGKPKINKNARKYPCQRCGKETINRFYCPACLSIVSRQLADSDYVY